MIVKLLPRQIPVFWEAIKYAAINADEVDEEHRGAYLNELLHSLLGNKCLCFIKLDDERRLQTLLLVKFIVDTVSGEKSLFLLPIFSWKQLKPRDWEEDAVVVKEFAKHEGCKYISFESRNPKVWQLGESLGFQEISRQFKLDLGGA
jgi:hypothetical protein